MNDWIREVEELLGRWDVVAARKTLHNLRCDEKSSDEKLMGYAVAIELYQLVFTRYARQRQTLTDKDEELLGLAVEIADLSIPFDHPLRRRFFKNVGYISEEFDESQYINSPRRER